MNILAANRDAPGDAKPPKHSRYPLFMLLLVNLLIVITGTIYFRYLKNQSRLNAEAELSYIAQLKLDQLIAWRHEQIVNAELLMENPLIQQTVSDLVTGRPPPELRRFTHWLETYLNRHHYYRITILNPKGEVLLNVSAPDEPAAGQTIHLENPEWRIKAADTRKPVLTDIHRDPSTGKIHTGTLLPVFLRPEDPDSTAYMTLHNDLSVFFFPLIQSWPTRSSTAETLLVRKDRDDVLFLNDLRHRPNSALNFRIPLSRGDLPASKAIRGHLGPAGGLDYRGEKVLSVLYPVPDSSWYMVAKIDEKEALSGWLQVSRDILLLLCTLILTSSFFFLWIWYRQNKNYFQKLFLSSQRQQLLESRFRAALELSPFPAMLHAENGNVIMVNQQWCVLSGFEPEEISTIDDWTEKAHGENKEEVRATIEKLYHRNEKFNDGLYEIRCKDGSTRIWDFASMPMGPDNNGLSLVLSMAVDVTEKQAMQQQLAQAEKLNSVGKLAGGVAHDFNNLLMGIMNYVDLCLQETPPESQIHGWLREINAIAERSAAITRQLLAFARKQPIAPKVLNLADSIGNMLNMLQRLIGEDVNLTWEPEEDLWPVMIDSAQLDQILANLCVNSRDAISGNGIITLRAKNISLDEHFVAHHREATVGDYVVLSVSDNGSGMTAEILAHAFEPFYTSKSVGKGTGLGLATVYGIVKQNCGYLEVHSRPGAGTTFDIYFPRHLESATTPKKPSTQENKPKTGHETILLTEDESTIRKTIELGLAHFGYRVLCAGNPEEGFAVMRAHPGEIDLLITDLVMPEMNGFDFASRLFEQQPGLKVIYMSGYNEDIIAEKGVLKPGVTFLAKPFTARQLNEKIRALLDGPSSQEPDADPVS